MSIFSRISTLLGMAAIAISTWADVPFKPTTITDGKFATDTEWYTLGIGAAKLRISDNGTDNFITLGGFITADDENMWCFVGNETDGFKIYNKKTGITKVLAAPATMDGKSDGTAYAYLQTAEGLANTQCDLWDFKAATKTSNDKDLSIKGGYFVNEHGHTSNILNNRGGKLAFWVGGFDDGSVVSIEKVNTEFTVSTSTGTMDAGFTNKWTSNDSNPNLTLTNAYKNMKAEGEYVSVYSGKMNSPYTLSVPVGYKIVSFSFTAEKNTASANTIKVVAEGKEYDVTSEAQKVSVEGLESNSAKFEIKGASEAVLLKDFVVKVERTFIKPEPQTNLMTCTKLPCYRIPAITKAHNGDIIAIADYRHNGGDIGFGGQLDLHAKISKDNGATWSKEPIVVVNGADYKKGSANAVGYINTGFGDPCLVADRESDRVLLMSCTGSVSYPGGTRNNHLGIVRFYSEDNGQTWSKPVEISESIYAQFDTCTIGTANSMFIGSGRIFQSSTVKVKDYYRIYCSVLLRDVNSTNKNYVIYSDDFGMNWKVLGGVNVAPIPSGADEPKAEELPDGSILCSSRIYGGRAYNIFHFTNSEKAEGYWDKRADSNASNNGVIAESNSCNGETMIVPATRKADGKNVFLFLQSVPFGGGRTNVGIYYKELASLNDFITPDSLAANWDGRHQSSYIGSAYSTMTLQKDNKVGFLYEESTLGYDYTIVYKNYSLEQITDSTYTFYEADEAALKALRNEIVNNGINQKVDGVKKNSGFVGCISKEGAESIETAYKAYTEAPSKENYEVLNAAIANAPRLQIERGIKYRIRNSERKNATLYLVANANGTTAATLNESDQSQLFSFVPAENSTWKITSEGEGVYLGATGQTETKTPVVKTVAEAATYKVNSSSNGLSALVCTTPAAANYPALHLAGDCTRIVPWTAGASASLWYIEPTDIATDIKTVEAITPKAPTAIYDLQGRRLNKAPRQGIYITSDRKKHIAK